jgi:hypothetical protein
VGVVALGEDRPAGDESSVYGARHPHGETLQSTREGFRVVRLDDEVQVVGLDGEVDDAKSRLLALGDGAPQGREEELVGPEARQPFAGPQGDMHRMACTVSSSCDVWHDAPTRGLAAGARTSTAVARTLLGFVWKHELNWASRHHDYGKE